MKTREGMSDKDWVLALINPDICKWVLCSASKDLASERDFINKILKMYTRMDNEQKKIFIKTFTKCTYWVGCESLVNNFQTIVDDNAKQFNEIRADSDRNANIAVTSLIVSENGKEILEAAAKYHRVHTRRELNRYYLFDTIQLSSPSLTESHANETSDINETQQSTSNYSPPFGKRD